MDHRNKLFIGILIVGHIGLLVGATHKVSGNEHAYIALSAGLIFNLIGIVGLIAYNFSRIKMLLK